MAEHSIHILSTRPLKKELVEKARQRGITADAVAFIQNIPELSLQLSDAINSLAQLRLVAVFTSIHAVEVVRGELNGIRPPWTVFSTGGATKEALLDIFSEKDMAGTAKNASNLAEKILKQPELREVFFFCSRQRLNDLPETLAAAGVKVNEHVVYQTVGTPVAIDKAYDAVLFFSPSGVHSFFSINTLPLSTTLFSIGKTTTATIESYCGNEVITSQWPGEASLVDLVIDHYSKTAGEVQSTP